jgi:hypothetical protein
LQRLTIGPREGPASPPIEAAESIYPAQSR